MKFLKILAVTAITTILCCASAMAASNAKEAPIIESMLERLTFAKAGDGDKTIFILCGAECPRCETFSALIDDMPVEQSSEFEFRWIISRGPNTGLLYVMETGKGVSEMFRDKQPKPIANEEDLMLSIAYNRSLKGQVARYLPLSGYTPIVIAKKDGVFHTFSAEDLDGKMYEMLKDAEHIASKPVMPEMSKKIFEEFKDVPNPVTMVTKSPTKVRIFPLDDSPVVQTLDAGFGLTPVIELGDWYGIDFQDPPFLFVKKSELKEHR